MWPNLLSIIRQFYLNTGSTLHSAERNYLANAFISTERYWNNNLTNIHRIKYIMLSEAPLWGRTPPGKYIYNPANSKGSSFLWAKNMRDALAMAQLNPITLLQSKVDLVTEMQNLGFLIIDVSPYALNFADTTVNYPQLSRRKKNNYYDLIAPTLGLHFDDKLRRIQKKLSKNEDGGVKVFYRYKRIENHLSNDISSILRTHNLHILCPPLNNIFKQGGGIDIIKLSQIL